MNNTLKNLIDRVHDIKTRFENTHDSNSDDLVLQNPECEECDENLSISSLQRFENDIDNPLYQRSIVLDVGVDNLNELDGWDQSSAKKFLKSINAGEHPHSDCVKHMKGKVSNPDAFCAKVKDLATGTTKWRGKDEAMRVRYDINEVDADDFYTEDGFDWNEIRKLKVGDYIKGWINPDLDEVTVQVVYVDSRRKVLKVKDLRSSIHYVVDKDGQYEESIVHKKIIREDHLPVGTKVKVAQYHAGWNINTNLEVKLDPGTFGVVDNTYDNGYDISVTSGRYEGALVKVSDEDFQSGKWVTESRKIKKTSKINESKIGGTMKKKMKETRKVRKTRKVSESSKLHEYIKGKISFRKLTESTVSSGIARTPAGFPNQDFVEISDETKNAGLGKAFDAGSGIPVGERKYHRQERKMPWDPHGALFLGEDDDIELSRDKEDDEEDAKEESRRRIFGKTRRKGLRLFGERDEEPEDDDDEDMSEEDDSDDMDDEDDEVTEEADIPDEIDGEYEEVDDYTNDGEDIDHETMGYDESDAEDDDEDDEDMTEDDELDIEYDSDDDDEDMTEDDDEDDDEDDGTNGDVTEDDDEDEEDDDMNEDDSVDPEAGMGQEYDGGTGEEMDSYEDPGRDDGETVDDEKPFEDECPDDGGTGSTPLEGDPAPSINEADRYMKRIAKMFEQPDDPGELPDPTYADTFAQDSEYGDEWSEDDAGGEGETDFPLYGEDPSSPR